MIPQKQLTRTQRKNRNRRARKRIKKTRIKQGLCTSCGVRRGFGKSNLCVECTA